jgi:hypothetical protein
VGFSISESGALAWEPETTAPTDVTVEHPLGETPAGHEHGAEEVIPTDALPSRTALMAMTKEELEAFAIAHDVDPTGATKQQIVDTLYG